MFICFDFQTIKMKRDAKDETPNEQQFRISNPQTETYRQQADVALEHHQQKSGNVNQHPIKRNRPTNRSTNKQAEWIDG